MIYHLNVTCIWKDACRHERKFEGGGVKG